MKYERMAGALGAGVSLALLASCGFGEHDSHSSNAELPPAIAKQIGGHVLQLTYKNNGKITRASAVRVKVHGNKTIDITVAHALVDSQSHCGDEQLIRKKPDGNVDYATAYKQTSVDAYKQTVAESVSESPNLDGHDAAGILNDGDADSISGVQAQRVLDIKPGATITFANYQDAPSGTSRDAAKTDKYGGLAEFTGTYIGQQGTKLVALVGGGESYGTIDESRTRSGASGGAAFITDKSVEFAGITVATSNDNVSAQDVKDRFGFNAKAGGSYHLTFIEPITTDVVHDLYQEALHQPECTALDQ